jgi:oligoendopeptidase F
MTDRRDDQTKSMEGLPSWDLKDIYTGTQDPKIQEDLKDLTDLVTDFVNTYGPGSTLKNEKIEKNPLGNLLVALLGSLEAYERIETLMGKVMGFAFLNSATQLQNTEAQQFLQSMQEKITEFASQLVFYKLELGKIEEAVLEEKYKNNPKLASYRHWFNGLRAQAKHHLPEEQEKLLLDKSITSSAAWQRLYDETLAGIRFDWQGEKIDIDGLLDNLTDWRDAVRSAASTSLYEGLQSQIGTFTTLMNVLVKDKEIEDRWRHYPHPVAARNLANQIDDPIVNALVEAVKDSYKNLSHRYYALKAKWMGKDQLDYWDRNAPLITEPEALINWKEAERIIDDAYHRFHPDMALMVSNFFNNPWIDAAPKLGKRSGAFCHPVVPGIHPYVLVNYHGRRRDVMVLAHELGHAVHQSLAAPQGLLRGDTPLTLAETASVFGEMLTFQSLLSQSKTTSEKRPLIAGKVEDMINTVIRQVAFFEFEKQIHLRRREKELSSDDIGDIWVQTQQEALGGAVRFEATIRPYWAYVSHFFHTPFYVYAYAFGECLVNSLYALYQQGHPDFVSNYYQLLEAGGSKPYSDLLAPFGLDLSDPSFWNQGLTMISKLIDQLETL